METAKEVLNTAVCAMGVSDVDEEQGAAGHGHYHCVEVKSTMAKEGNPSKLTRPRWERYSNVLRCCVRFDADV